MQPSVQLEANFDVFGLLRDLSYFKLLLLLLQLDVDYPVCVPLIVSSLLMAVVFDLHYQDLEANPFHQQL